MVNRSLAWSKPGGMAWNKENIIGTVRPAAVATTADHFHNIRLIYLNYDPAKKGGDLTEIAGLQGPDALKIDYVASIGQGLDHWAVGNRCPDVAVSGDIAMFTYEGADFNGKSRAVTFNTKLTRYIQDGELYQTNGGYIGTSFQPAPVVFKGLWHLFRQGRGQDGRLWHTTNDAPRFVNWSVDTPVAGISMSFAPSVVVYRDRIHVFYEGPGEDRQTYHSIYDGQKWAIVQQQVPGNFENWGSLESIVIDDSIYLFVQDFEESVTLLTYTEDVSGTGIYSKAQLVVTEGNIRLHSINAPFPFLRTFGNDNNAPRSLTLYGVAPSNSRMPDVQN
jgi:hypothetical protein